MELLHSKPEWLGLVFITLIVKHGALKKLIETEQTQVATSEVAERFQCYERPQLVTEGRLETAEKVALKNGPTKP